MVTNSYARAVAMLIVVLLAFGLRVAAATKWHGDTVAAGKLLRLGDSDSYWILAGHIARGEPYQYGSPDASIFRAPLYPLALAPFATCADASSGIYWARIMGCVCGAWAVYLVMCITRQLITITCGTHEPAEQNWVPEIIAGGLAAIYPGAIGMSIVLLSEAIFCPLMLLTLLGWQRALVAPRVRPVAGTSFMSGMASGLAILARPSWLLFMPLAGATVLLVSKRRMHQGLVLFVMAAGCVLVMAPWWYRNWLLTARLVPTTLQVGASLYDGLHAGASGASDENMEFVEHFIQHQRAQDSQLGLTADNPAQQLKKYSSFEYRLNASMQRAALDWAGKNISGAIRLALVKFARTWSLWPGAGQLGSGGLKAALTLGCFGILALATVGSVFLRVAARRVGSQRAIGWPIAVCWGPAVYFTLLHMVFVGSIRYREPAVLVLSALAGCAFIHLRFKFQKSDQSTIRHGSQSIEATSGITSG